MKGLESGQGNSRPHLSGWLAPLFHEGALISPLVTPEEMSAQIAFRTAPLPLPSNDDDFEDTEMEGEE